MSVEYLVRLEDEPVLAGIELWEFNVLRKWFAIEWGHKHLDLKFGDGQGFVWIMVEEEYWRVVEGAMPWGDEKNELVDEPVGYLKGLYRGFFEGTYTNVFEKGE